MQIILANPRGFCAGVDRAIDIVNRALEIFGAPIYVRHEVVHNRHVVETLREKGAIFVEELDEVPDGATVIFSAHGVPLSVVQEAERRGLQVFDATCPLVTKVHLEVARHAKLGREVILIGHAGHPEVEGTMGRYDTRQGGAIHLVETVADVQQLTVRDPQQLAYVTQTTLSMDDTRRVIEALRAQFPAIQGPKKDDICYATQNRQDAVKQLALRCRAGRRLAQQLQLKPPARTGHPTRQTRPPDRQRQRVGSHMVCRVRYHRPYRLGIRTGCVGRSGD